MVNFEEYGRKLSQLNIGSIAAFSWNEGTKVQKSCRKNRAHSEARTWPLEFKS